MSQEIEITADGVTQIEALPAEKREITLLVRGDFGSGTLTPGYMTPAGVFQAFGSLASAITAADEYNFTIGPGVTVALSLAGSTNPVIFVVVT